MVRTSVTPLFVIDTTLGRQLFAMAVTSEEEAVATDPVVAREPVVVESPEVLF